MTNKPNGALRAKFLLLLTIASALMLSGCNDELRDLINKERLNRGIGSLKRCENELDLGLAALGAADKSAKEGSLLPPDFTEVNKNADFRCFYWITARGRDAQTIHEFLMSKDEYRNRLLSKGYRWVGTGAAKQDGGLAYESYIFAGDKDSCPLLASTNGVASMDDRSFATNGVEEAIAGQESASQTGDASRTTGVCCASAGQLDVNRILSLSPELLDSALRDSTVREKAFQFLLSDGLSFAAAGIKSREISSEQLSRAEELVQQLAEKHPALRYDLLKAWDEFKLSTQRHDKPRD